MMVTLLAVKEDVTVAAVELPLQLPMCLAYELTYTLTCIVSSMSFKR